MERGSAGTDQDCGKFSFSKKLEYEAAYEAAYENFRVGSDEKKSESFQESLR